MPLHVLHDAKHWRERAEEARSVASGLQDDEAKRMMLGVANSYEILAQRAERREADDKARTSGTPND